jgi:putative transcriptional regulator
LSTAPVHHVPESLLLEYVAGTATEAVSLVVACHLALCTDCQTVRGQLEALGGTLLESTGDGVQRTADPGTVQGILDRTLSLLDAPFEEPPVPAPLDLTALGDLGTRLPSPLMRYLRRVPDLRWRLFMPGFRLINLPISPGAKVRLVRLKPGLKIPRHDHEGTEELLVITGALREGDLRLGPGDFSIREAGDEHEQRVEPGPTCIALVVNEGRLVPRTMFGRVLGFLSGQ